VTNGPGEEIGIAIEPLAELRDGLGEYLVDRLIETHDLGEAVIHRRRCVGPHSCDARTQRAVLRYELDERKPIHCPGEAMFMSSTEGSRGRGRTASSGLGDLLLPRLRGFHIRSHESQHPLGIVP